MVSSRFASRRLIKTPAVCHKELYGLPLPYDDGPPRSLSALAIWHEAVRPVYLAETFRLIYDAGIPGWTGQSDDVGFNLVVVLRITATPNTYDIEIVLRIDTAVLDDDSWHAVTIPPGPPFDSGRHTHHYGLPFDYNEVRIRD